MAKFTMDEFNREKSELAGAINRAIADADAARKSAPEMAGDAGGTVPADAGTAGAVAGIGAGKDE